MNYFIDASSTIKRSREDVGFPPGEMVTKKQKGGSEGLMQKRTQEVVEVVPEYRSATSFPVDLSDWFVVGSDVGFDGLEDGFGALVSMDYSLVEQVCLGWIPSEFLSFCGEGDIGQTVAWEEDDIWRLREIDEAPSM